MLLGYMLQSRIDRDDNAHTAVDFRLYPEPRCRCLPILTSPATPGYTHLPGDDDWAINSHRLLSTQSDATLAGIARSGITR